MNFVESFSAEMQDLMDAQERQNLRAFMENIIDTCQKKAVTARVFPQLSQPGLNYQPSTAQSLTELGNLKLVTLTDSGSMSDNLRNMLQRFQLSFTKTPEVIDLTKIKIAGGCLGCMKCGMDNECAYDGKDDVRTTYEQNLRQILLASAETEQANLVGIITDEFTTSTELDQAISNFSEKLLRYATIKVKKQEADK